MSKIKREFESITEDSIYMIEKELQVIAGNIEHVSRCANTFAAKKDSRKLSDMLQLLGIHNSQASFLLIILSQFQDLEQII